MILLLIVQMKQWYQYMIYVNRIWRNTIHQRWIHPRHYSCYYVILVRTCTYAYVYTGCIHKIPICTSNMLRICDVWRLVSNCNDMMCLFCMYIGWLPWRDHVRTLCESHSILSVHGITPVIISFQTTQQATQWCDETSCLFTHYISPQQHLYHQWGIQRSLIGTWKYDVISYYADQIVKGRELPKGVWHTKTNKIWKPR